MKVTDAQEMIEIGRRIGGRLRGGECIELLGDVGAGKTTLMKGIGEGLAVDDDVQSPSFTLSREYAGRDGLRLAHYDFYRLSDAGVLDFELAESLLDPATVTAVEWGASVDAVLPDERIVIRISYDKDSEARTLTVEAPETLAYVVEGL